MINFRFLLVLLFLPATGSPLSAQSNPAASIYDAVEVGPLVPRFRAGWVDAYRHSFRPVLTPQERARLDHVDFKIEPVIAALEPFAFYAGGNTVVASAASLKFLDDLSVATAWTHINGYSLQTIDDYLMMLRYWRYARGNQEQARPPKPLAALCIPADALANSRVEERARRLFNSSAAFILLHEYGHILGNHPGNRNVAAAISRANEEDADRFALDVLARINEAPIGLAVLFQAMAQVYENRADYASQAEYEQALAGHTHPVSAARLQAVARHIAASGKGFIGDSRVTALNVSLQISQFALLMADHDLQRYAGHVGRTVSPADLGPRRAGHLLAASCSGPAPTGLPFDGVFRGIVRAGRSELTLDAVLHQAGDRVTGTFSFGAGYARVRGIVEESKLKYDWNLSGDRGRGTGTVQGDAYEGTWGKGTASTGEGSVSMRRLR